MKEREIEYWQLSGAVLAAVGTAIAAFFAAK